MSDGALLFILLAVFAASLLFAGNAFIRARTRRKEEQLRRELPLTIDEDPRPSAIPAREHAKTETDSLLLGLTGGGVAFVAILSWSGLSLPAALAGLLLYLVIAAPIALWLRGRKLKRQRIDRPVDDTSTRQ